MSDESPTNAAEFTVSEISGALKRLVEDSFGNVRVRGEISGYRGPHSSGHAYFSLKDDKARIEAVVWRGGMSRLKFQPEEGMEVIATGKLTTFPGSSKYQIVIEQMEPAGAGALMALLDERKRRLSAEGLFSAETKQLLPFMPRVIGVVTSPTGAVIRDIIHRINDRFPLHVLVWPVRVQGETCGPEVANAVDGFNALETSFPRPDVIIVARGGGSLEDLWGFNDEIVVRAVANSLIPVISAVGHETDWTLIDFAADVRAPTPTGAAEMAVPVRADLIAHVAGLGARLAGAQSRLFERKRQSVRAASRALPSVDMLMALPRRRFDEAVTRLERGLTSGVHVKRVRFSGGAGARLQPELLQRMIERRALTLVQFGERIDRGVDASRAKKVQRFDRLAVRITPTALTSKVQLGRQKSLDLMLRAERALGSRLLRGNERLQSVWRLAQGLSHERILERGFALVRDENGAMVRSKSKVASGQHLSLQFLDGQVSVQQTSSPAAPKPKAKPASTKQGALF